MMLSKGENCNDDENEKISNVLWYKCIKYCSIQENWESLRFRFVVHTKDVFKHSQ